MGRIGTRAGNEGAVLLAYVSVVNPLPKDVSVGPCLPRIPISFGNQIESTCLSRILLSVERIKLNQLASPEYSSVYIIKLNQSSSAISMSVVHAFVFPGVGRCSWLVSMRCVILVFVQDRGGRGAPVSRQMRIEQKAGRSGTMSGFTGDVSRSLFIGSGYYWVCQV